MKLNVFNMDISKFESYTRINCNYIQLIGIQFFLTIVRLNKRGKKSGCIWQPAQLYRVRIIMPMLSIAFLHWFATFQTQTSSTVKSDSIFQGLVYLNFLPPLSNPSIVFLTVHAKLYSSQGIQFHYLISVPKQEFVTQCFPEVL